MLTVQAQTVEQEERFSKCPLVWDSTLNAVREGAGGDHVLFPLMSSKKFDQVEWQSLSLV